MSKLSVIFYTKNQPCFDLFKDQFKMMALEEFAVMRVKDVADWTDRTKSDQFDLMIVEAPEDQMTRTILWNQIRGESLECGRTPLIWIGEPIRDPRWLAEVEIGLTNRIVVSETGILGSLEVLQSLESALKYIKSANERNFSVVKIVAGEKLFNEGDTGDCVYILLSGRLEASRKVKKENIVVGAIEVGEFVGEMAPLQKCRRTATVLVLQDAELVKIPAAQFEVMLTTKLKWSNKLLSIYTKRIMEMNQRLTGRNAA